MTDSKIFQYVQLKSIIHADFWHKLAEIKLDIERLNEKERVISGSYSNYNAKSCLFEIDCTAFHNDFKTSKNNFQSHGVIKNFNTVESFKNCDKNELLRLEGERLLSSITNGSVLEDPTKLSTFLLLSYAVNTYI